MRQLLASLLGTLALLSLVGGGMLIYDRTETAHWIGSADLNVTFEIYDAASGEPISNARIVVQNHKEGSQSYEGALVDCKAPFMLSTNVKGEATRLLRNIRCTGAESRLRFTNTQRAYLPMWDMQVLADGYQATGQLELTAYFDQAEYLGPGQFRLVVRIPIEK